MVSCRWLVVLCGVTFASRPNIAARTSLTAIAAINDLATRMRQGSADSFAAVHEIEQMSHQMVEKMGNATTHLTTVEIGWIQQIIQIISGNMFESMTTDHNTDKQNLIDASDKRVKCNTDMAAKMTGTGIVFLLKAQAEGYQQTYDAKQVKVQTLTTTRDSAKTSLTDHMSTVASTYPAPTAKCTSLPAQQIQHWDPYFEQNTFVDWFDGQRETYQTKSEAYAVCENNLSAKKGELSTVETQLRTQYCAFVVALHGECQIHAACYTGAEEDFDTLKTNVESRANERKNNFRAGKLAIAHLKFLIAEIESDVVDEVNTSDYHISVPDIVAQQACEITQPLWEDFLLPSECEAATFMTDGFAFKFSIDVKFDNFDQDYPYIMGQGSAPFAFHGMGPAYDPFGTRGHVGFYILTVKGVGASGRGGGQVTTSTELNPGQWYTLVVEKTAEVVSIEVVGQGAPSVAARTVPAADFQMKPISGVDLTAKSANVHTRNFVVTQAVCQDVDGWEDSMGRNCAWYAVQSQQRCEAEWVDDRENDGRTATAACCTCGGGSTAEARPYTIVTAESPLECPAGYVPTVREDCEQGITIDGVFYARNTAGSCSSSWPGAGCFVYTNTNQVYYSECNNRDRSTPRHLGICKQALSCHSRKFWSTYTIVGKTDTIRECESACKADQGCSKFSWFDAACSTNPRDCLLSPSDATLLDSSCPVSAHACSSEAAR